MWAQLREDVTISTGEEEKWRSWKILQKTFNSSFSLNCIKKSSSDGPAHESHTEDSQTQPSVAAAMQ